MEIVQDQMVVEEELAEDLETCLGGEEIMTTREIIRVTVAIETMVDMVCREEAETQGTWVAKATEWD